MEKGRILWFVFLLVWVVSMQWAMLAVILIGLFLISGRFPKLAFSVFGVLVAVVIGALVFTSDRVAKVARVISVEDVTLSNMTVVPAYGGSYRFGGRLQNSHEEAELRETMVHVFMLDCANHADPESQDCMSVGQQNQRLNTRVPSMQARDFQMNLYFGSPVIQGKIAWRYEVTEVKN